jgi:hypothetical protein
VWSARSSVELKPKIVEFRIATAVVRMQGGADVAHADLGWTYGGASVMIATAPRYTASGLVYDRVAAFKVYHREKS